jgi:hypothetical protein
MYLSFDSTIPFKEEEQKKEAEEEPKQMEMF